ncbi:hypothetical protein AB1Y20_018913 [Prymnesium parvum]|uniref:UDP-glucose 4-epimerase n=1 Tax=Prymnesium parvum TaxID=97485 RepID=A0AB34JPS7_PRYPA
MTMPRLLCLLLATGSTLALQPRPPLSQATHHGGTALSARAGSASCRVGVPKHVLRLSGGGGEAKVKTVLVTGGVGYIGSHTVLELLTAGYEVVIIDNLCNSNLQCLRRVEKLAGRKAIFYNVDLRDKEAMAGVFAEHDIDSVIHFAGLKAVGESVALPLLYYQEPLAERAQVNVQGTLNLIECMQAAGCCNIVFSSSATVYGDPASVPVTEDFPTGPTNPYGHSKLFNEQILKDFAHANPNWNVGLLRYFNPVGAHPSGEIGEDPRGIPNNLMPFIQQVAVGKRPHLSIFGSDYNTADGTGVRDYIHVVDLAKGHIAALRKLETCPGCVTYNLGTGIGYSVLDMVKAYSAACGRDLPYKMAPRRPGDVGVVFADPTYAKQELGWVAELGMEAMCADSWRWISKNPNGFGPGDEE